MPQHFIIPILAALSISAWAQQPPTAPPQPPIVGPVQMPPTPPKSIRDLIRDFGPLIAASAALYVGYTQRRIQRQQLQHNIFDKRFVVYKAADTFVADISDRSCKPERQSYHTFLHATDPAQFLFGAEVLEALRWIEVQAGTFATELDILIDRDSEGTELQRFVNGALLAAAFSDEWDKRKVVFWRYLQLHDTHPWYIRLEDYMERLTDCNEQRLKRRYEKPSM